VIVAAAGHHLVKVSNHTGCAEKGAIHPPTPLFHQHCQTLRPVSESLRVGDVLHSVACVLFDVNLKAHDSVFGQVLVGD